MKKIFAIFLALTIAGCGHGGLKGSRGQFTLRPFQEEKLENGLRILWINDDSLPRVSMNMLVEVGSLDEGRDGEGLNSFTVGLLNKGTAKHSAPQLAQELEQLGADYTYSGGTDFTTLAASGLSTTKSKILSLFSEIVLTPSFKEAEIERQRSVVLSAIVKSQDQPTAYADERLDQEVFGEHPYGAPTVGNLKSVKNFRRTDLIRQYYAFYRPNNTMLAVVGNFDEGFRQEVRQAFQGWAKAEVKRGVHKPAANRQSRVVLVNKTGLQQTQIRMGHVGIPRTSKDFLALRMANLVLGGAFASRLNQKIRDDMGLTYSISSGSEARAEPGSFEISTFTRHEKAAETILETRKLIRDFVDNGVSDEELASAKALLIGQFPASLETADRVGYNLMVLRRYGLSDDYLRNFQSDVQKMTKAQVNEAIRRNLHPDQLQVVIYSDAKALGDLSGFGPLEKVQAGAQ